MDVQKRVHNLVLDSGPIIRNDPSVSSLIAQAETLITIPAVITEIRDEVTRSRVETLLKPFLTLRQPSANSVKFVTEFARRTGDLAVLSKADIQVIALTYELECERNAGDWRLRKTPGQKGVNGPVPERKVDVVSATVAETKVEGDEGTNVLESRAPMSGGAGTDMNYKSIPEVLQLQQQEPTEQPGVSTDTDTTVSSKEETTSEALPMQQQDLTERAESAQQSESLQLGTETAPAEVQMTTDSAGEPQKEQTDSLAEVSKANAPRTDAVSTFDSAQTSTPSEESSNSDSEGWITPSNLKKKQTEDTLGSVTQATEKGPMQVAVITTDFAMQNVILQINLNLLSSSLQRVKYIRSTALRCQACFLVSKEMDKQFCPRCGKPSLTRVSCSTTANGEFKVHLKKNFQYNSRGDRYSIPKPVHGSANGRIKGGGKGGWGNELILTEDQKEYERAAKTEKRTKERNLMDEDYLPGILTGERRGTGGRIKVGAGRNVNTKKR